MGFACLLAFVSPACDRSPASRLSMDSLPPDTPKETREFIERLAQGTGGVPGLVRGQALIDLRDFKGDVRPVIPFVVELIADNTSVDKQTFTVGPGAPPYQVDRQGRRTDGKESVTTIAAEAQATLQSFGAASVRPLLRALEHTDREVAAAASYLLPLLPPTEIEPTPAFGRWEEGVVLVDRLLRQGRPDTLVGAAFAARYLGDPRHIEPLLVRAGDRSSLVRKHCVSALGALAVDPAAFRYQSPMPPVAVTHAVAFRAVLAAANDSDPEVRQAAATAMTGVIQPDVAQALCSLVLTKRPQLPGTQSVFLDREEDARDAAFRALEESVNRLLQNKAASPETAGHPFAQTLRDKGGPSAFAPYMRNRWGHLRGVRLMELLGGPDAASALVDALHPEPAHDYAGDNAEIIEALRRMTGKTFKTSDEWRRWHAERKSAPASAAK